MIVDVRITCEILTMENRYLQMKHGKDTSHCLKKFNVTHDNTNALIHKKRNQFTELNEPGFSSVQFILQVLILFDKSLEFILKSVLTPEQTNRVQKIQQNIVNVLLTSNFQSTDLKMFSNLSISDRGPRTQSQAETKQMTKMKKIMKEKGWNFQGGPCDEATTQIACGVGAMTNQSNFGVSKNSNGPQNDLNK